MAQELVDKIRAAAQARGIDPELALSIARAESSLNPSAKAKTSTASGLFQVTKETWKEYGGRPGKQFDPDENIRVGLDIIAKNTSLLRNTLNREPRPAEIYAAHYFGPTGARSFLTADPATPITKILGDKAVRANPNLQGKTAGQVLAQLEGKVGGAPATAQAQMKPATEEVPAPPMRAAGEPGARTVSQAVSRETAPTAPVAGKLASLGPGYQAALALSFLADEDEKEGRDPDTGPSVAEQWLAQTESRPAGLALSDISVRSPFAALGPEAAAQPVMMNEGGDVSTAAKMLKEVVPMDLRMLGSTLMGSREPITESNFNPQELAAMQQAVDRAVARTGRAQKGSVQYQDYPRGEEIGPGFQPVGQTLGRFTYEKMPDGTTVVRDRYDFYNEGRKENVEAYEKMGRGQRAATVAARMLKNLVTGDLRGVPNELADAYIGREGRDVTIKLPPVKRAGGGDAEPTPEELAAASRPATVNPMIRRQGEAARRLAAMRDVNTLPDPRTYAAVTGFFGVAPDEQGFSALHPDIAGIKKAGEAGFYAGTAAQVAPIAGQAAKMLGKLTGSALNERLLSGQSLTPGISTPAPITFAVKPKGGTVLYTHTGEGGPLPVSKLDNLMMEYRMAAARDLDAPDELVDFIKKKAPRYFTTTFGTADDPLRTAIRGRAIEPFGRDASKIPPYLVDAAKFPQARGHLQAKQELERMYDELTGVEPLMLRPDQDAMLTTQARRAINQKMAEEGVPVEAQNAPSVTGFMPSELSQYPYGAKTLSALVQSQDKLPSNIQHALRTGEVMYDIKPGFDLLSPENVVDALKQIPTDKLKNMSFPEALIQGTQALAPVRDYRAAIDMAERGAKLPPTVLQQFTTPVVPAPGGTWVQITNPVATELEGKLMKHSVGGYGKGDSYGTGYTGLPYGGKLAFDDGLVRVYSLRDKAGEPTITVEMARPKGQENWNVTQIRGRFNSEPADKESVFSLLNKIDESEGLGKIKANSYSRSSTGADVEGSMVDWGGEYDKWKQGISE